jgi:hypothetical protein
MHGRAFDMYRDGYSKTNQWSQAQHDALKAHGDAQGGSTTDWNMYAADRHLHVQFP